MRKMVQCGCGLMVVVLLGCVPDRRPVSAQPESGQLQSESRLPASIHQSLETAWSDFEVAYCGQDMDATIDAAECFLFLTDAVHSPSLCPEAYFWITWRRNQAKAFIDRHVFSEYIMRFNSRYDQVLHFSQGFEVSQEALLLIEESLKQDHWTEVERVYLADLQVEWIERQRDVQQRYDANKDWVVEALEQQQRSFVTTLALKDYQGASEIYDQQHQRRFNHKVFGYPRDNGDLLNLALQRLNRIIREPLVDEPVRAKSMMLAEKIERRFTRKKRSVPVELSAYRECSGFPILDENELLSAADIIP
jgi:hypothetical protein